MADVKDYGVESYKVEKMSGMGVERTIALSNHPSKAQLKLVRTIPSGDGGFVGVIYRESGGADIKVYYQDKYPIIIKGSSEKRTNARKILEEILGTRLISEGH